MEKGLISIIVPVYNNEDTLSRCVDSLLNQTYSQIEIIIVDDGSLDKTLIIAEEYQKRDIRVRVTSQKNKGVSAARNIGLSLANGEYCGFCDSDDWAEADMFEKLMENMLQCDADVSIVQFYLEELGENISTPFGNDGTKRLLDRKGALLELNKGELFLGHLWNKLFRVSAVGGMRFDESISICEDVLFVHEVLTKSRRIVFQNVCKYHYVVNPKSAMNKPYSDRYMSRRLAYMKIIELLRLNDCEDIVPYASRSLVIGDIAIAKKMWNSKVLCKQQYLILQKDSKENYRLTRNLYSRREKFEVIVFTASRSVFCLYLEILSFMARMRKKSEK